MSTLGLDIGGTSIKSACLDDHGNTLWTAQSPVYVRPSTDQLLTALHQATHQLIDAPTNLGLCLPGRFDPTRRIITHSVNVPALNDIVIDDLLVRAFSRNLPRAHIFTDAHATAHDLWFQHKLTGRMLVLALGTGVGAAVLDDGTPLHVDGPSPGHIGQLDVSIEGHPVIGPDGGAGSLEGYLGAPALSARYGPDFYSKLPHLTPDDPPLKALARTIRICHAIYRPQHILLAGGIGIALKIALPALRRMIETHLSSIAAPVWTLACAESPFHAALGAARLALTASQTERN